MYICVMYKLHIHILLIKNNMCVSPVAGGMLKGSKPQDGGGRPHPQPTESLRAAVVAPREPIRRKQSPPNRAPTLSLNPFKKVVYSQTSPCCLILRRTVVIFFVHCLDVE